MSADIITTLGGPAVGIIGVLAGSALSEYFRRTQRAEQFLAAIFAKRLNAYETLMGLIHKGSDIADNVINNPNLSPQERHDLISEAILTIADHVDRNALYVDEDLGAHCTALFMGTEDIHDAPDFDRQGLLDRYLSMQRETHRMLLEESGAAKLKKVFQAINRPKLTSPIIDRLRELRTEQQVKEKV